MGEERKLKNNRNRGLQRIKNYAIVFLTKRGTVLRKTPERYETMTIFEATIKAAKEQNKELLFKVLNKIESTGKGNPQDVVLMADINAVGYDSHRWAWDTFEAWQNA
jgi:hypothetical protein